MWCALPAREETFKAGHIESPLCKEHRQYYWRRRRQQKQLMGASLGAREVGQYRIPQGGKPSIETAGTTHDGRFRTLPLSAFCKVTSA